MGSYLVDRFVSTHILIAIVNEQSVLIWILMKTNLEWRIIRLY